MYDNEIKRITEQLVNRYAPERLLLFGSQAKNNARPNSDIDLCVITKTEDKHKLLTDMYINVKSEKPFDLLLYTPDEWEVFKNDDLSFAYIINTEGVVLYA